MKKFLMLIVLLTSLVTNVFSYEEEDELAAEAAGMTIEGYLSSTAYKTKKAKAAKIARCDELQSDLENRIAMRDKSKLNLERRYDELGEWRSSIERRAQLLNATPGDYGGITSSMWVTLKKDEAEYNSQNSKWKRERDVHNRKNKELASDVDDYNEECATS